MNAKYDKNQENWREYKLEFGKKHVGETLFQIYVNDFDYLIWLDENATLTPELKRMIQYPLIHKQRVDPFYVPGFSTGKSVRKDGLPSERFYEGANDE